MGKPKIQIWKFLRMEVVPLLLLLLLDINLAMCISVYAHLPLAEFFLKHNNFLLKNRGDLKKWIGLGFGS